MDYIDKVLSFYDEAELKESNDVLFKDNLKNIPKKLYKYRNCNPNGFDALEQDYLWADNPTSFLDPMDSRIHHRLRYELPDIRKWLEMHIGEIMYYYIEPVGMRKKKGEFELDHFKAFQKNFLDENGNYNSSLAKKAMTIEINKLPVENKNKLKAILNELEGEKHKAELEKCIKEAILQYVNSFRESVIVSCLTEDNNNSKMWEGYANNYSGFCVEYLIDPARVSEKSKDVIINLFKIKYYKRIPGVNTLPFIKYSFNKELYGIDEEPIEENKKLIKQLVYKKFEYNSEQEWRIILDEDVPKKIEFPFASAVYAGYRISDDDLKTLKTICEKKKIPLYIQRNDVLTNNLEYEQLI